MVIDPKRSFMSIQSSQSPVPFSVPGNLLSFLIYLPFLDISYKWKYTICVVLHLASFTQHMFLRFIHVVECISSLFLFIADQNSLLWIEDHILLKLLKTPQCTRLSQTGSVEALSSIVALGNSTSLKFFLLISKIKCLLSQHQWWW